MTTNWVELSPSAYANVGVVGISSNNASNNSSTLNPLITYEIVNKYTKDGENRIVVELKADVTGNGAIMPISNYDFGVGNHDPNTVDVLELLRVASPQYFI
jgi:hypothetical protein